MTDATTPPDVPALLDAALQAQQEAARTLEAARRQVRAPGPGAALPDAVAAVAGATSTRTVLEELARHGNALAPEAGCVVLLRSDTGDTPTLAAFWQGEACWVEGSKRPGDMPEALERISRGDAAPALRLPLAGGGLDLGECRVWLAEPEHAGDTGASLLRVLVTTAGLALSTIHLRAVSRHRSVRESLTGLFNRRYLEDTLERELHRCRRGKQPLGIIQMDLDGLAAFNRRLGRGAGDRLLQAVAGLLQSTFRGSDAACRIDDDTFVILLPEADLNDTRRRAEELREMIATLKVPLPETTVAGIPASIGVAGYPDLAVSSDELLLAADSAVQLSRESGGNAVTVAQRAG